ncbi:hypothetical protein [Lentibacillus saliphilus]|uniref:hypothetical protein n=1 Tax=Lentibacillus saliphilus TaxID=2737028 RepID=UPI001C2F94C7|nr:hypothetical protein [Lentibacillus saliphilus]
MRKFLFVLGVILLGIVMSPVLVGADEYSEPGKCEMTIISDQHDWYNKAEAKGDCSGRVSGYYLASDDQFMTIGAVTMPVTKNGQKFTVGTPNHPYGESILTVYIIKNNPEPKPEPKPDPKPDPEPDPEPESKPDPKPESKPNTKPQDNNDSSKKPVSDSNGTNESDVSTNNEKEDDLKNETRENEKEDDLKNEAKDNEKSEELDINEPKDNPTNDDHDLTITVDDEKDGSNDATNDLRSIEDSIKDDTEKKPSVGKWIAIILITMSIASLGILWWIKRRR